MKFPAEDKKVNFIEGIISIGGAGGPAMKVRMVLSKIVGWSWYHGLFMQCKHGKAGFLLF